MTERVLTSEQTQMLGYLRETFPGLVVLPNLMLRDMLSVRRAADPQRARAAAAPEGGFCGV